MTFKTVAFRAIRHSSLAMTDVTQIVQMFESRIRERFPEFAASLRDVTPDGHDEYIILDIPWPPNPSRCSLGVLYRGDCFEVAFSVADARGPAESQVIIDGDLSGAVVATVEFLGDIVSGRILVDVHRYRFLWFRPYYLAFFREASRAPRGRIVETLSWTGIIRKREADKPNY